jgi:hypothetical protein
MEEKTRTTVELTEKERTAIEEASGRPGYGALRAGIVRLLEYWLERERADGIEREPEPEVEV